MSRLPVPNIRGNLFDITGKVVAIKSVTPEDQLVLITRKGVVNRQRVDEIRVIGRATQGVRLMNLDESDVVMDVARILPEDEVDEVGEGAPGVEGEEAVAEETAGAVDAGTVGADDEGDLE